MQLTPRKDRNYSVVDYESDWPSKFQNIKKQIKQVFGNLAVQIEHVGSTSVPGLAGKPTIDVLVIVQDIDSVDNLSPKLKGVGYIPLGAYLDPAGRQFAKEEDNVRSVNIHCFESGHRFVRQFLLMRDYMRSNAEDVKGYSKIKNKLYQKYPKDYAAYRNEKDKYLAGLEKRAEDWGRDKEF